MRRPRSTMNAPASRWPPPWPRPGTSPPRRASCSRCPSRPSRSTAVAQSGQGPASAGKDSDLNVVDMQRQVASAPERGRSGAAIVWRVRRALEVLLGRYPAAEIEGRHDLPRRTRRLSRPASPQRCCNAGPTWSRRSAGAGRLSPRRRRPKLALLPDFSISLAGGRLGDPLLTLLRLNPWLCRRPSAPPSRSTKAAPCVPRSRSPPRSRRGRRPLWQRRADGVPRGGDGTRQRAVAGEAAVLDQSSLRNRTEAVRIATEQYLAGSKDLLWVSNLQTNQIATEGDLIKTARSPARQPHPLLLALGGSFDPAPATTAPPIH